MGTSFATMKLYNVTSSNVFSGRISFQSNQNTEMSERNKVI